MKTHTKKQLTRLRISLIFESQKRNNYIKKHKVFKQMGNNVFFQPRVIPSDPELIKFHNNIVVASNVTFINHDLVHTILNNLGNEYYEYNAGCIEIMDNVFIGSNTTILPNIKIGPNAIIAAGSVITKDVQENTIVAGVPAKVIGTFDEYVQKRKNNKNLNNEQLWQKFNIEKGIKND